MDHGHKFGDEVVRLSDLMTRAVTGGILTTPLNLTPCVSFAETKQRSRTYITTLRDCQAAPRGVASVGILPVRVRC